jgi:Ran GTPase-activating protein (RanGAP) involved in mRNA processing and transport
MPYHLNAIQNYHKNRINKESNGKENNENDKFENYPFKKEKSKIENEKIAGIRIKGKNISYLGYEKNFYSEAFKDDESFSDINFFKKFPKLLSIEFNGIQLTNKSLKNIQKFLQQDIKNIVFDSCEYEPNGEELVADIIKKREGSLTSVNVKQLKFTHEETEKITSVISSLSNLDSFKVSFGEITDSSIQHISSAIKHSEKLKTLSIAYDKLSGGKEESSYEKLLDNISELHKLDTLEISILNIPEKCAEEIFTKIEQLHTLENLRLFFGNLIVGNDVKLFENAELLADSLKSLGNLKSLNLSSMKLPSDVMQVLAQSIAHLKNLEVLNISGNVIDKATAEILGNSFKELDGLKVLVIRECEIDSTSFSELAKSMASLPLVTISAGNNLIKEGLKNLPVKSMTDLKFIDFANNGITFETLMSFLSDVASHPSLRVIDVKNNKELHGETPEDTSSKRDQLEKFKLDNKMDVAIFGF